MHPVDAILIPTPFYGVITEDLHLYSDVKLFHVPLDCEVGSRNNPSYLQHFAFEMDVFVHTGPYSVGLLFLSFLKADGKDNRPFRLTVRKLEEGLQRAKEEVTREGMPV